MAEDPVAFAPLQERWPRWFQLPTNPPYYLVLLRRPFTFLFTLLWSFIFLLASLFFAITRLPVPSCFLCDDSSRTRPRPRPKATREARAEGTPVQSRFNALGESLASSSRTLFGLPRRAPKRRVPSRARTADFHPHSLENVDESDEEGLEEEDVVEERADIAEEEEDGEGEGPGLTHQGESDSEPSEVDTVADSPLDPAPRKGGKDGVRRLFSRKPRRDPSTSTTEDDETKVGGSCSSSSSSKASTPAPSITGGKSQKSFPCPARSLRRAKSSRAASPSPNRPPLLSTFSDPHPNPRVFVEEPSNYKPDDQRRPSLSRTSTSSVEATPPSPLDSASSSSMSPGPSSLGGRPTTKRVNTSPTFSFKHPFRSLSPLSRSPATSPKHSPPPSPKLAPQPQPQLKGRRKSSDELGIASLSLRIGRAREGASLTIAAGRACPSTTCSRL
ncbi:hypothetical protein BCR35DRAFT_307228, partial [Leucosporidium creatinivorum]